MHNVGLTFIDFGASWPIEQVQCEQAELREVNEDCIRKFLTHYAYDLNGAQFARTEDNQFVFYTVRLKKTTIVFTHKLDQVS